MNYHDLVKIIKSNQLLTTKYGKTIYNLHSKKEISWEEAVTIFRFGQDYFTDTNFIKENVQYGLNPDVFKARESILEKLPDWLIQMKIINLPLSIISTEQELESMKKNKHTIIKKIGETKYNELVQKLEEYIKKKK